MLNNKNIWKAIEAMAKKKNSSCSGIARISGLDPTAFNRSKRQSKYGQPRWPTMGTIVKVLNATNTSFSEFAKYVEENEE